MISFYAKSPFRPSTIRPNDIVRNIRGALSTLAILWLVICAIVQPTAVAANVDLLTNGNFDSGPGLAWVETGPFPIINDSVSLPAGITPHSGNYVAWLGGDVNVADGLSQSFVVPVGTTSMNIAAHFWITTAEILGPFDTITVAVDSNTIWSLNNEDAAPGWTQLTANLDPFINPGLHTLQITSNNDASAITSFFVDTVSIDASVVPVPAGFWLLVSGFLGLIEVRRRGK